MTTENEIDALDQLDQQLADAAAAYDQLVIARFRNDKMTAEHIASVLQQAGKTTSDLRGDVQQLHDRAQLQETRRRYFESSRRSGQLATNIATFNAETETLIRQLQQQRYQELEPMIAEREELNSYVMANVGIDQRVRECRANRPLLERERSLETQIAHCDRQIAGTRQEYNRVTQLLSRLQGGERQTASSHGWQEIGPNGQPKTEPANAGQIANLQKTAATLQAAMQPAIEQRAEAARELAELRREIMGD